MSLISDLINVLTPEEAETLKKLEVTGKEKQLLHILIESRNKPEPTNECLIRQIETTPSNCDKLKSYLLQKSYTALVPQGGIALLTFLTNKKFINHLLYREIPKVEKGLKKTASRSELRAFYRSVFHAISGVSLKDYNQKLTEEIGKKLIAASANLDDELYVEAKLIWIEINAAGITASLKNKSKEDFLRQKIEAFETKASKANSNEGNYQINYLWQWFFTLTDRVEEAFESCEKNIALLKIAADNLPVSYHLNTEFKYAEMLYFTDRFKQAHKQYMLLFYEKYPERLNTEIYHIAKFAQVCIVTENFSNALNALHHYANQVKPSMDSSNVITILHFAKVYMAMGQIEEGYNYVLKARNIISKNIYVQYEIELRNLENFYFYMRGDRKFAVSLARKNIKYLNSKDFTLSNIDYGFFYHLIVAFYHLQEKGRPLTRDQKRMFEHYQHGSYAQYGYLLKKIMNNCNLKPVN